jgi:hypothetical protein
MVATNAGAPILNLDHGTAELLSTDERRRQVMPPANFLFQAAQEPMDSQSHFLFLVTSSSKKTVDFLL